MIPSKVLMTLCVAAVLFVSGQSVAEEDDKGHPLAGISLRSIGPALTSGRVSDFAFVPGQWQKHYVAMASGNLWKTENNGVTIKQWSPEMLETFEATWNEVAAELAAEDEYFAKVWADLTEYREGYKIWSNNIYLPRPR